MSNRIFNGDDNVTWTVILVSIIISLVKILMTCLPTGVVNWLLSLFEVHPKLEASKVAVNIGEFQMGPGETRDFVKLWNESISMQKHYIWPGTEHNYINRDSSGSRIIITTKMGKHELKIIAFVEKDQIEVVKHWKRKIVAYSLSSDKLYEQLPVPLHARA